VVQEVPYAGVHAPDLLAFIQKFTNHREYYHIKMFTQENLSDVFVAYPHIFRNKGCSRTCLWGKVFGII
jgi:hypothetical protein